jgi:hypothetical protein
LRTPPKNKPPQKPLQFLVSEEEFDHFGELVYAFAGNVWGAKTAFFRELISSYESNMDGVTQKPQQIKPREALASKARAVELEAELERMRQRQNLLLDLLANQNTQIQ